jgi:hypothetical protein
VKVEMETEVSKSGPLTSGALEGWIIRLGILKIQRKLLSVSSLSSPGPENLQAFWYYSHQPDQPDSLRRMS